MGIRRFPLETGGKAVATNPRFGLIGPIFLIMVGAVIGPVGQSRAQYGIADRVGQALENAGRNVRMGVRNAVEASGGPVPVMAVENPLVARVHARLQWEKLLAGSTMELEVLDDGTAFLRGEVASKEAKERAFVLTRDTLGINKVIDELVVTTPDSRVAPDPLPTTPAVPTPPIVGPAASIRVRPARRARTVPVGSTTIVVPGARVVVPAPVVTAPPATDVIVNP